MCTYSSSYKNCTCSSGIVIRGRAPELVGHPVAKEDGKTQHNNLQHTEENKIFNSIVQDRVITLKCYIVIQDMLCLQHSKPGNVIKVCNIPGLQRLLQLTILYKC